MTCAAQDDASPPKIGKPPGLGGWGKKSIRGSEKQKGFYLAVDKTAHLFPCSLVGFCGPHGQQMRASVHIGVIFFVVVPQRVDDDSWFLGCGCAVEIQERLAVVSILSLSTRRKRRGGKKEERETKTTNQIRRRGH